MDVLEAGDFERILARAFRCSVGRADASGYLKGRSSRYPENDCVLRPENMISFRYTLAPSGRFGELAAVRLVSPYGPAAVAVVVSVNCEASLHVAANWALVHRIVDGIPDLRC